MTRPPSIKGRSVVFLIFPLLFLSCGKPTGIRDAILNHENNFYYIDTRNYPDSDATLPVGVFDSGTGGLSVMADIIRDDGLKNESFIYLGDLANMPYGNYSLENNTALLIEHVIKDVQFLLGNKYYCSGESSRPETDKKPVKTIVIACNTATAYALDTIKEFMSDAGLHINIIGVIDAGVAGAFTNFSSGEDGSIAVMATDGTVRSEAYPRAIEARNSQDGQEEDIMVFQQAGIGIAEAIDETPEAIDRKAHAPRMDYRGPSDRGEGEFKIDMNLWNRYDFDIDNGALLFEGEPDNPTNIQINSVENYIAFHVVSLLEKVRSTQGALPLNSVILACTHYPFYEDTFRNEFRRLRDYSENGEYLYRSLIAEDLILVNPSVYVARQLYENLSADGLLNPEGGEGSEFYISVPDLTNRNTRLREDGSFTYEYKYNRTAGDIQEYVKVVPFSRISLPDEILKRLSGQIPEVYSLMSAFNSKNPKTRYLSNDERIVME